MRAPLKFLAAVLLILSLIGGQPVGANFWDMIGGISQIKSLIQYLSGDKEGAKRTQENFVNQAPIISQLKSAGEAAVGKKEEAKKTQEEFAKNAKEVAQATPVLGHIIGGIQIAKGDKDQGLASIKAASSSTGALLGGIAGGLVGGPAGAAAGALAGGSAVDGIITGVESANNKKFTPYGNIDYFANIKKKSAGEHADQGLGIFLDLVPGKPKAKPGVDTMSSKVKEDSGKSKDADSSKESEDKKGKESDEKSSDKSKEKLDEEVAQLSGSGPSKKADKDADAGTKATDSDPLSGKELSRIDQEVSSSSGQTMEQVRAMSDQERLGFLQDSIKHLPEAYRKQLRLEDFYDIRLIKGWKISCYMCTLVSASRQLLTRLAKERAVMLKRAEDQHTQEPEEMKVFKDTDFPNARATVYRDAAELRQKLLAKMKALPRGATYKFGLSFLWNSLGESPTGRVQFGRAWLDAGGYLKMLFNNFQVSPDNKAARFTTDVPDDMKNPVILELGNKLDTTQAGRASTEAINFDLFKASLAPIRAKMAEILGKEISEHIGLYDIVPVNNIANGGASSSGCPWCVTALKTGVFLGALQNDGLSLKLDDLDAPANVKEVLEVYKTLGYPDTELVFSGNDEKALLKYLDEKLEVKGYAKLVLAYQLKDSASNGVNSVMLLAWKDKSGKVELVLTDYSYGPNDPKRYKRLIGDLDGVMTDKPRKRKRSIDGPNALGEGKFHLIQLKEILELTVASLVEEANSIDAAELSSGSACQSKLLIGYVASWSQVELTVKQAARFTNLIYAFAPMHADGTLTMPGDSVSRQRLLDIMIAKKALRLRGVHLAVSVAIGGWENSQHFSSVVANGKLRGTFISYIVNLMNEFDGVDIDWEYPGTGGATNGTDADRDNYVIFLKQLRASLPKGKIISVAGAAGEEAMRGFDIKKISELVDWIGVMTYDFNGAWESEWGAYVGPVAPLHHASPPGYSGRLNANWALKQYVCRSEKASKIVMGLPFYGRYWTKTAPGKDPENYPLSRKAELVDGKYGGELSYGALQRLWFGDKQATRQWDEKSNTPWAMHGPGNSVLSYDDAESLAYKVAYSLRHDLGGVMVWSLNQDDDKLTLTRQIGKACSGSTNTGVSYKCNPLGEERRWWQWTENATNAGMCGRNAPLYKGYYAHCDPDDPGFSCCSKFGYCGSGPDFCDCPGCVDYGKYPDSLTKEPQKPSRPVQWHVGFDLLKPGEPRCGSWAPPIGDHLAICNPDDDNNHCCSTFGYCGTGPGFCDCPGCKNYRKLSLNESLVKVRRPEEIRWHVGFKVLKPGQPRCGPGVALVQGQEPICDPDDDQNHCCSPSGYCGSGPAYCDCPRCKDARKL